MIDVLPHHRILGCSAAFAALAGMFFVTASPQPVHAQTRVSAFAQAVAEAGAENDEVAAFYRSTGYVPIWTGNSADHKARRSALLAALTGADDHGLPQFDVDGLKSRLKSVESVRDLGRAEVEMSRLFIRYAASIHSGVLTPARIDSGIVRDVPRKDGAALLAQFVKAEPRAFLKSLAPRAPEYARLMKEKLRLEALLASGGWGDKVSAGSLKPGKQGASVVELRNRLIRMGYLERSASKSYDATIQKAVQRFQRDHGITPDGVAGSATMKEINKSVRTRLSSILVAMERERWTNIERGSRHVWVNLTDFSAKIVDGGRVTFASRSVIGKDQSGRRSPEFSDVMEYMVINPTWNVPRSIVTKEYLPMLQRNRNAVSHLNLIDSRGRVVNRSSVNFGAYTARSFPFAIKQPPSSRNALGLVKFIFPNKHNIYLHDTPSKSLFDREVRAFSHGCIRLGDPFGFAYAVLAAQSDNPKGDFHRVLKTGRETRVNLESPIPVHIVYRTAVAPAKGKVNYRRDVYGRDAKVWAGLQNAGVVLGASEG